MLIQAKGILFLTASVGGCRSIKKRGGTVQKKTVRKPFFKKRSNATRKDAPTPSNKKPPPLTLPTRATKGANQVVRERRGILVRQVALAETIPIMFIFDL